MAASEAVTNPTQTQLDNLTAKLEVFASGQSTHVATLESTIAAQAVTLKAQSAALANLQAVTNDIK
eukprot:3431061-Heterocapsa_arctica.AAC.1